MSPLEVAGLVDEFDLGPITLYRANDPTQNAFGGFDDPAYTTSQLSPVAAHTATGKELERVPEADRHREVIQVYTQERLYVADAGRVPDRLLYRSRLYRVASVEDYEAQGGVYIVTAVLEEEAPP